MSDVQQRPQELPVSSKNFGLIIAYVIPGFLVVAADRTHIEFVRSWIAAVLPESPAVAGFLYITLAPVAAGMVVSALRWLVVDTIHHWTGLSKPDWDVGILSANLAAFVTFVEYHYRYYQFYANTLVAIVLIVVLSLGRLYEIESRTELVVAVTGLLTLLFLASRNSLRQYYFRTNELLHSRHAAKENLMTNGCHHDHATEHEVPKMTSEQEARDELATIREDNSAAEHRENVAKAPSKSREC